MRPTWLSASVKLSMSGDSWSLAAVIECKSPTAKPWAALMVPDKVTGFEAVLRRSDSADEESWHRLISAWAGFVPFSEAASADALVSVHEDQKATTKTPDREAA